MCAGFTRQLSLFWRTFRRLDCQSRLVFRREFLPLLFANLLAVGSFDNRDLSLDRLRLLLQRFYGVVVAPLFGVGSDALFIVGGCRKVRLQPVIIGLRDRIVLVIVAARTGDRQAENAVANSRNNLG